MVTRKDPGGGKKPPRKPVTSVNKPKAKITKSRGSNTPKQIGDQNLRETASGLRDSMKSKNSGYYPTKGSLVQPSRRKGGKGK
jgi:hypothetical protein